MHFMGKVLSLSAALMFTSSAFCVATNRLDVLGYAGYSQVSQFSESSMDTMYGTMTGFNGGAAALVTLTDSLVAPVIGLGAQYMQLSSSNTITVSSTDFKYNNKLTSGAATGHIGLRVNGPLLRLFLLGNAGYGLSDKISTDVVDAGGLSQGTLDGKMKNHMFYGGTVGLLVSVSPFIKLGILGVYNMHTTSIEYTIPTVTDTTTQSTNYQEMTGNLVVDINF